MVSMHDVIIIGAGVAGLTAAYTLKKAGRSVCVLEARGRIGGRMHSVHDPLFPLPVELGAEFVHGRHPLLWDTLQRAGLPTVEVLGEHWGYRDGAFCDLTESWERVFAQVLAEHPPGTSVADVLRKAEQEAGFTALDSSLFVSYVEGYEAASIERVSARAMAFEEGAADRIDGDRNFRVFRGYDAVPAFFSSALDPSLGELRLRHVVRAIRTRDVRVVVEAVAADGAALEPIEGRHVIVTVPLGVLQCEGEGEGALTFDPPLSDRYRNALHSLAMGGVRRVSVRFRDAFWEQLQPRGVESDLHDLSFVHGLDLPFPVWWTPYPLQAPMLTGWCGGPRAEAFKGKGEGAVTAGVVQSLASIFELDPAWVREDIVALHSHDWMTDPYARGAYSWIPVGGEGAQDVLNEPVDGVLYFAGEALNANGYIGTVHGAMETGVRAAGLIVEQG